MADLTKITRAPLSSALSATGRPSELQLSAAEATQLALIVDQMQTRYPAQDMEDSVEGILWDLKRLALRTSLRQVIDALAELRIRPGQRFFPRPDEVAEEIENQRASRMRTIDMAEGRRRREEERLYQEKLMSPIEIAWRIDRFGYDPFTEKR